MATINKLTDSKVQSALKAKDGKNKLSDGGGLYLAIGSKSALWRFKYRFEGREQLMALGDYPRITLANARKLHAEAREKLANGINPMAERKVAKIKGKSGGVDTFQAVAELWLSQQNLAKPTTDKAAAMLSNHAHPWIGSKQVASITPADVLAVLERTVKTAGVHSAHRLRARMSQIFRFAAGKLLTDRDPAAIVRDALPPDVTRHHAAITEPEAIGGLLRAIDGYMGGLTVRSALRLAPLLFVRAGELRHMEWGQIDWDNAQWNIPDSSMKMKRAHIVPLSRQAVDILRELHPLTGHGRYCFPNERTRNRPISENTIGAGLKTLGYSSQEMTPHGFRTIASTFLNERGYNRDWIEKQLAHEPKNQVRAAYNRAEYLEQRITMMQEWADHCDTLRSGVANVTPIFRKQNKK